MISQSMKAAIIQHTRRTAKNTGTLALNELLVADAIHAFLRSPEYAASHSYEIAVLIKAAQDAARELDQSRKDIAPFNEEERIRLRLIVERVHAACEQLGEKLGEPEEANVVISGGVTLQ